MSVLRVSNERLNSRLDSPHGRAQAQSDVVWSCACCEPRSGKHQLPASTITGCVHRSYASLPRRRGELSTRTRATGSEARRTAFGIVSRWDPHRRSVTPVRSLKGHRSPWPSRNCPCVPLRAGAVKARSGAERAGGAKRRGLDGAEYSVRIYARVGHEQSCSELGRQTNASRVDKSVNTISSAAGT